MVSIFFFYANGDWDAIYDPNDPSNGSVDFSTSVNGSPLVAEIVSYDEAITIAVINDLGSRNNYEQSILS